MLKTTAIKLIELGTIKAVQLHENYATVKYSNLVDRDDLELLSPTFAAKGDGDVFTVKVILVGSIEPLKPWIEHKLFDASWVLKYATVIYDKPELVKSWGEQSDVLCLSGIHFQCKDPMTLFWRCAHIAQTARNISVTKTQWERDSLSPLVSSVMLSTVAA